MKHQKKQKIIMLFIIIIVIIITLINHINTNKNKGVRVDCISTSAYSNKTNCTIKEIKND